MQKFNTGGITRRGFIKAAGSAALILGTSRLSSFADAPRKSAGKMNLVIITTDDNDAESLGCFGCPIPGITPNMDALAKSGVRFTHAHTSCSVCQPTRLSLMSGRYPQTNGNTGFCDPLKPGVTTLPMELKKAGYFTAIVGKQPHYPPAEAFGWDADFFKNADAFDDTNDGYCTRWASSKGMYNATKQYVGEAKKQNKPFFLHLNTSDPHRPWPGSIDEAEWYCNAKKAGQQPMIGPIRPYAKNYSPAEVPVPGYLPDLPGVRVDLAQYYSSLHHADITVGRILDALNEAGVADNTVIVCFGDQGASFPFSKQNLYRVSTRIPLMIRWPGVTKPGTVIDNTMVSIIDLMPTLLEGLGLEQAEGVDGRSALGVIRNGGGNARDYVHTSYTYAYPGIQAMPSRAVQSREFLYIYNAWPGERNISPAGPLGYGPSTDPTSGLCYRAMKDAATIDPEIAKRVNFFEKRTREEFYDLRNDPYCLTNLIDDPAHKAKANAMRDMVEEQMERTNDPLLAKFQGKGPIPPEWLTCNPKN
ncbi:MAG: sulfatase-like hydrolase/transferase [Armatimonadota bacterium]